MLKKLTIAPGVVKTNSDYSSPGRYIDTQWVRFASGFPEKMGGWASALDDALSGMCRAILTWADNTGVRRAAYGTSNKLYVETQGVLGDVTPLRGRNVGALSNPVATTSGSSIVTITDVAHNQQASDWVTLTAASAVADVLLGGNYSILTVPTADTYTIDTGQTASATTTGGGATSFIYYRLLLDPNPLTVVAGNSYIDVNDPVSGAVENDTVIFSGAAAVGGVTLDGAYPVMMAAGTGYRIQTGTVFGATATGGGSAITVQNEISTGLADTGFGTGYGAGIYGLGTYGTARDAASSLSIMARTWSLAAYGEWLLANPRGGAIYVWDPVVGGRAIELYNAPTECLAMFVTSERYIIALGKDGDPLKIGWPDQLDPTAWTATLTNTANPSRRIQGGSTIMAGREVRNQTSLIFTDTSLFLHQWRADDFIFSTVQLASNCGLIGPRAFTVAGEVAYWIGDGQFWKWDGAITLMPSTDVLEWFFENLNRDQRAKIYMDSISSHNELLILYPETGHIEINRYLLFNVVDSTWAVGAITRTAWADHGLYPYPLATDASGNVWEHETGHDGDGAAIEAYVVAAPIDIADFAMDVFGFLPDIQGQVGELSLDVLTRQRAQDTPASDGPFTITVAGDTIDLRSAGQMAGYRIESNVIGGDFRIGTCRVEVQPAGARRP